jgi:hypothetical protein
MSNFSKSPTIFYSNYQEGMIDLSEILQQGQDISGLIQKYRSQVTNFDPSYGDYDLMDMSGNLKPQNGIADARLKDLQNILIQENTLYMVGVVTTVSLIIAAIFIIK